MSELKSVAIWHPESDSYSQWHTWFSSRGWMVVDAGDSVEAVPEVAVWVIAWNEQFQRSGLREQFQKRRRLFPNEIWCAVVLREHIDSLSVNEITFLGVDEVFAEPIAELDYVQERLDLALRQVQLPASRHRVRESIHIRSKTDLAESISALTGHLMRETDALALTFWLASGGQGLRAWLRRTQDRIEALGGSLRDPDWEEKPGDQWGIPRRARAHRWELTSKDEMAWWIPLVHRRKVVGYLELAFPSSLSTDIEAGCLRAREWAPVLVATLQGLRTGSNRQTSQLSAANVLVDSARRSKRPLSVLSLRSPSDIGGVLRKIALRSSDVAHIANDQEAWVVLPETDRLAALLLVARMSAQLEAVHIGLASLPEDGITFDQLGKFAHSDSIGESDDDDGTGWTRLAEGGIDEFKSHFDRVLSTLPAGERGRVVVVSGEPDVIELQALPKSWSGILVSRDRLSKFPERWRRAELSTSYGGIEVVLIATNGLYGVRSDRSESPETGHFIWSHCAQPNLILRRWHELTQEFSLGGS